MANTSARGSALDSAQDAQQLLWTGFVTLVLLFLSILNPTLGVRDTLFVTTRGVANVPAPGIHDRHVERSAAGISGTAAAVVPLSKEPIRLNAEPVVVYRFREAE